jgi:hypothetical protein
MGKHWSTVKKVLEVLASMLVDLDPDGIDLAFTLGGSKGSNLKAVRKVNDIMDRTSVTPEPNADTDIVKALGPILQNYLRSLRRFSEGDTSGKAPKRPRRLNVFVLTDGKWEGTLDDDQVTRVITKFAKETEFLAGEFIKRPVGIQFIQFGDDPTATSRLEALDQLAGEYGIPYVYHDLLHACLI